MTTTTLERPARSTRTEARSESPANTVTYADFMRALWADRTLKTSEKCVLAAMAYHSTWKTGANIYPGNARVAEEVGLSHDRVDRLVPKLVDAGWLTLVKSGRGGNSKYASEYRLAIPEQALQIQTGTGNGLQTGTDDGLSPIQTGAGNGTSTSSISNPVSTSGRNYERRENRETGDRDRGTSGSAGAPLGSRERRAAPPGRPDSALDRTYYLWERKGAWRVFRASAPPVNQPRDMQTVTLPSAEDAFYREYFAGGSEMNADRAAFLLSMPEDRAKGMEMIKRQGALGMEG